MKEKNFARIVETKAGQILMRVSYNNETENTEIIVTAQKNGNECSLCFGYEEEERAYAQLEKIPDEVVEEMIKEPLGML